MLRSYISSPFPVFFLAIGKKKEIDILENKICKFLLKAEQLRTN